jgi:lipopolysaccharide export system protein LptA
MVAWAEKADRGKPMNIEADNLDHDELKQLSIFTGKVVATKGTLICVALAWKFCKTPRVTNTAC